ncbi:hypothetical protein Bca52824_087038 [Brassica carinata]|uniref:Uncharacterized protein n=1 Tax=Brassica carinata TaxID=52824 RepID=A0A8X7TME5_BRACI|nr:hypothetical protein Bca52824_087038 [Brassica carinata]
MLSNTHSSHYHSDSEGGLTLVLGLLPRFTQAVIIKWKQLFSVSRIEALRKITDQICKGFRGKRLLSGSTRLPILTPTTRFPSSLVSISNIDIVIKEASAKETTDVKQLNMACKADGRVFIGNALIANCIEEEVSDQLRGLHGQATTAMLQLPEPVADTLPNGLRVPEFHLGRSPIRSAKDLEENASRNGSTRPPILTPATRFPSSLVSLSNMDIVIKEASAKETTDVKQLNMI